MNTRRLWLYRLLTRCLPESRGFGFKRALLRWAGAQVADDARICSSAVILGDGRLVLGRDVWIGPGVTVSATGTATVTVDDFAGLALGAMVFTGSHEIDPGGVRIHGEGTFRDVTIGKGCMIGARATILPGVTLAEKTLVAAGAVVSRPVAEPCGLVAGVPAVWKKSLKRQ